MYNLKAFFRVHAEGFTSHSFIHLQRNILPALFFWLLVVIIFYNNWFLIKKKIERQCDLELSLKSPAGPRTPLEGI